MTTTTTSKIIPMNLQQTRAEIRAGGFDARLTRLYGEATDAVKTRYLHLTDLYEKAFGDGKDLRFFFQLSAHPCELLFPRIGLVRAAEEAFHILDIVDHDEIIIRQKLRYRDEADTL